MRLFSDPYASVSDAHLRRALELAERGRGATAPNPLVGCVLVRDGAVVGEGFHTRFESMHAEVVAIADAGELARGATAYVTLEPCAHHGRTPPCADALIDAGVSRVVIGMSDPNPVAAGGAARLRSAGVEVVFADDPAPFQTLNEAWLARMENDRPWVQVKVACTLDGALSVDRRVRTRLSGDQAAAITMRLRGHADAVLVGARTALVDQPSLTTRAATGQPASPQPLRVILARDAIPVGLSLYGDDHGPVVVLCREGARQPALPAGVEVHPYPAEAGVNGALKVLAALGVDRVLVEPGPTLFTTLWDEELLDELVVIHVGTCVGVGGAVVYHGDRKVSTALPVTRVSFDEGSVSHSNVRDGVVRLHALVPALRAIECGVVGSDVVTVWRPSPSMNEVSSRKVPGGYVHRSC